MGGESKPSYRQHRQGKCNDENMLEASTKASVSNMGTILHAHHATYLACSNFSTIKYTNPCARTHTHSRTCGGPPASCSSRRTSTLTSLYSRAHSNASETVLPCGEIQIKAQSVSQSASQPVIGQSFSLDIDWSWGKWESGETS